MINAPHKTLAVAAPKPVLTPARMPETRVRWIQSRPIGPIGIAMEKPTSRPANRKAWFIIKVISFVRSEKSAVAVHGMTWPSAHARPAQPIGTRNTSLGMRTHQEHIRVGGPSNDVAQPSHGAARPCPGGQGSCQRHRWRI